MPAPATQLDGFFAKYPSDVAALGRAAVRKMHRILPGWIAMVYDNYNALVIGFSPTDRPSDAICSIALYLRWVNLFFLHLVKHPRRDQLVIRAISKKQRPRRPR